MFADGWKPSHKYKSNQTASDSDLERQINNQLKMRDRTKPITGHMQVTCLVIIASELENIKDIHCYIVFLFANNTYSIALIFNYAFRSHILQVC